MMSARTTQRLLLVILLCLSGYTQAAYITDQIEVEVYAQPFGQGAKLGSISSGSKVEVLTSDGEYARILTQDNITGWIEARYLSDSLSTPANIQAMEKKLRDQEAELKATREKLTKSEKSHISDAELKKLRQAVKDANWLRVERKKAREQIKALEAAAKSSQTASSDTQQTLEQLQAQNADLEQRLVATLLINEQDAEFTTAPENPKGEVTNENKLQATLGDHTDDSAWRIKIEWFLGSLFTAIVIGIILGINWMDKRVRRRHGGFRIY